MLKGLFAKVFSFLLDFLYWWYVIDRHGWILNFLSSDWVVIRFIFLMEKWVKSEYYHCVWMPHFTCKAGIFMATCLDGFFFRKTGFADLTPFTKFMFYNRGRQWGFFCTTFLPLITGIHWLLESILYQILFCIVGCVPIYVVWGQITVVVNIRWKQKKLFYFLEVQQKCADFGVFCYLPTCILFLSFMQH